MAELFELTVTQASSQIREGGLSPVSLMESLLARVEALEPRLNVWVTLDADAALEAARQSERKLEQNGPTSPLHGIPVGIKDIIYTKGVKTTCCSPIYADFVPDYDATVISRLKDAGAIIMGKTVTTQFASGDPSPTRNPWNTEHTPGGSSSGSAAGLAARMFPASLGTQTGGSVLRPASYNGVVGLKPTFGRISKHGVYPLAWSLDTVGAMARSVEDAALLLNVLAGYDAYDLYSANQPTTDFSEAIGSVTSPRIGVLRQYFEERADQEVWRHTQDVVKQFSGAGASIEEVTVPTSFEDLMEAHSVLAGAEAADIHQANFATRPDDFAPSIRSTIERGIPITAVDYLRAEHTRREFRIAMEQAIRGFDVLLTPSTPTPAPKDLNTTGNAMFQSPWTACGFPTITIPSGLSASGLPLGIQLASAPFEEARLLAVAHWCEQVIGFNRTPKIQG
jgi:aspartyl-tRNA(Asn)/glutamyl-tRNA(Gln) amidotransferase subunit A